MDWQTFLAIGIVLAFIMAILDITGHLFGFWDRWKRWRNPVPQAAVDQTLLKARIRLAIGPGSGFRRISKRRDSGSITIEFRNEGLHPAYNFFPTLTSDDWGVSGHANGMTIPPHQERFCEFPFPYFRFPLEEGHSFTLTAPYRDGTGDHVYTLRFHFTGQDFPDWQPAVESEG